jgi:PPOX class probable F420-dependent enzyme
VDRTRAEEFLKGHTQAVLATIRRDGRPQLTSVIAVYLDGKLVVSTTERTAKYRNLRRDPRVGVHVAGDSFWQYLVVYGMASFVHMPEALPGLHRYYEAASGGPHPDWADYDRAMAEERRVLLSVSLDELHGFNI